MTEVVYIVILHNQRFELPTFLQKCIPVHVKKIDLINEIEHLLGILYAQYSENTKITSFYGSWKK